jgi:hypothetical protein
LKADDLGTLGCRFARVLLVKVGHGRLVTRPRSLHERCSDYISHDVSFRPVKKTAHQYRMIEP